jgi:hypothetical protein
MEPNDKQHPEHEPVLSKDQYRKELEKALQIGPGNLSNAVLFRLLRGVRTDFLVHFWADVRPFFVELWRRIENKQIADIPTKTEACRLIGCSVRWAERIVAGTARKRTADHQALDTSAPPSGVVHERGLRSRDRRLCRQAAAASGCPAPEAISGCLQIARRAIRQTPPH